MKKQIEPVSGDAALQHSALKPCPFCGGEVEMHYTGSSDWEVVCRGGCEVETMFWVHAPTYGYGKGEQEEAIRRWNRRAEANGERDRLRHALKDSVENLIPRGQMGLKQQLKQAIDAAIDGEAQ
jgi:hypothetical protein